MRCAALTRVVCATLGCRKKAEFGVSDNQPPAVADTRPAVTYRYDCDY